MGRQKEPKGLRVGSEEVGVAWLGACCLQGQLSTKSQKGATYIMGFQGLQEEPPLTTHTHTQSKRHLTDKMQFLCDVTGLDSRHKLDSGWQL